MLFAGFTAAKKTPRMCGKTYWIHSLLQIVTYACTTAWINGAKPLTIDAWQCFLSDIRDCIKEWLLRSSCPSLYPSFLTGLWDIEYVSVVLFCYILDVMLCMKRKSADNKKKDIFLRLYMSALYIENRWFICEENTSPKCQTPSISRVQNIILEISLKSFLGLIVQW